MRHHCPPFLKPSAAGFVTVCLILSATFSVDDSGHYPADLPGLRAETLGGADKLRAVFIALIQERVLEVQQRRCLEHPVVDDQLAGPVVRDRIVHHVHLPSWFFYCPSKRPGGNKKTTLLCWRVGGFEIELPEFLIN